MMAAAKGTRKRKPSTGKNKKSVIRRSAKSSKKESGLCFTIMPFGGWFDDYYETVFQPAIEASGLTPRRADDLYRPSTIVNDIWSLTKDARIILADLSGKNPNVFYELGLAHALAKPAILVVESMDDVPFDLRALRILEYDKNDPNWGVGLTDNIQSAILEVLESPASAVLPTFLDIAKDEEKTTVTPEQKELLDLRNEIEIVKRENLTRTARSSRSGKIGMEEAKELIERYVRLDLSPTTIRRRLADRGAPADWVERELLRVLEQEHTPVLVQAPPKTSKSRLLASRKATKPPIKNKNK